MVPIAVSTGLDQRSEPEPAVNTSVPYPRSTVSLAAPVRFTESKCRITNRVSAPGIISRPEVSLNVLPSGMTRPSQWVMICLRSLAIGVASKADPLRDASSAVAGCLLRRGLVLRREPAFDRFTGRNQLHP